MTQPLKELECGLREELVRSLGRHRYRLWFRDTSVLDVSEQALRLAVPTDVHRAWMQFTFAEQLQQACTNLLGEGVQVELQICEAQDAKRRVRDALPRGPSGWERLVASRRPEPTFDNFLSVPSGRFPLLLLRQLVQGGGAGTSPVVYLVGPAGSGKTHLCQAFGNEVAHRDPSACVVLTARAFTQRFVAALRMRNVDAVHALEVSLTSRKFVVIDDLDELARRQATQAELARLMDLGLRQGTRFLFAAREHPDDLDGLSDRLRSRLVSGVVTPVRSCAGASLRELLARRSASCGIQAPDAVLDAILDDTVCVAGAVEILDRWVAASATMQRPLEASWLPEIAPGVALSAQDEVIHRVKDAVATHFQIDRALLDRATKARDAAFPRRVAMYLVFRACALPLTQLGEAFGLRSHSSASRAIRELRALREKDPDLDSLIDALLARL